MDLGIRGRRAIVCASSRGLGYACAEALAREGCEIVLNGRNEGPLQLTSRRLIEATGARVTPVAADLCTEEGRHRLLAACQAPDILINNNGGPPPGRLADWDHAAWMPALEANLLSAALLIRAVVPGMRKRRFGRIVNITSAMVKSPQAPMGLSAAARAGLTALTKAVSREVAVDNVTLNNLLPERIDTPRQEFMAQQLMREAGIDWEEARRRIASTLPAQRFGMPEEFGAACAFLCSAQAAFISGQSLSLDGGASAGLF
ncbi:SDR family oxidoreductase [Caldimonas tepidiphila]|uniref:SDR family oxidoreductase n=1 Tax=Caldimonas tepidiphila TaxID=2315841 RepID=UPI000E5B56FC|nr:SDR family oxidoreductase [Caldimonas tepidiphila]